MTTYTCAECGEVFPFSDDLMFFNKGKDVWYIDSVDDQDWDESICHTCHQKKKKISEKLKTQADI